MGELYALIVGCNYPCTRYYELRGCVNDANNMYERLILRNKLTQSNIQLLTDDPSSKVNPTAAIIKEILKAVFSSMAKAGDIVFLFFAGHATLVPDYISSTGRYEEAIVASDFNLITRIDLRRILSEAPKDVKFVIMSDSCLSGRLIDKEKEQIAPKIPGPVYSSLEVKRMIPFKAIVQQLGQHGVPNKISAYDPNDVKALFLRRFGAQASVIFQNFKVGEPMTHQVILISGCTVGEACNEMECGDGTWQGVFTVGIIRELFHYIRLSDGYWDLVRRARRFVQEKSNNNQNPCLYCDDKNKNDMFLLPSNYKIKPQ